MRTCAYSDGLIEHGNLWHAPYLLISSTSAGARKTDDVNTDTDNRTEGEFPNLTAKWAKRLMFNGDEIGYTCPEVEFNASRFRKKENQMQSKTRAVAVLLGFAGLASAQSLTSPVSIRIPASSVALPGDAGLRSHTNVRVLVPANSRAWSSSQANPAAGSPPFSGYLYQTPASIACIYGFVTASAGCNPNIGDGKSDRRLERNCHRRRL